MEDNLNNFSSVELNMLLRLADMPEFHVLQKLHDLILKELKELNFNQVPLTKGELVVHAERVGHKMAWDRDKDLKKMVTNFISLKSKQNEKIKSASKKRSAA